MMTGGARYAALQRPRVPVEASATDSRRATVRDAHLLHHGANRLYGVAHLLLTEMTNATNTKRVGDRQLAWIDQETMVAPSSLTP